MVQRLDPAPTKPHARASRFPMVTETHPLPTASAEDAARLYARELWRDPSSDCYDPLRVLCEGSQDSRQGNDRECVCGNPHCSGVCKGAPRRAASRSLLPGILSAVALLALTACATSQPAVISYPKYVDRPRNVMQPIPAELLRDHPIAEGPPSQCPSVAAQRRAELNACNADKAALRAISGKAVEGAGDE